MIHYLNNSYLGDHKNIIEWFDHDLSNRSGRWGFVGGILPRIYATWGLSDELEFMRDIYSVGLSVEYINIFWVNDGVRTLPWSQKIRQKPWVPGDVFFDNTLEDRNCLLVIGSGGVIQWIDGEVTDSNRTGTFTVTEISRIDGSFICPVDRPLYFNNVKNNVPLFMIHVAFEGNPTKQEVVDKLSRL
jgi:hypothetical protein